jgi:hypothetical protein
MAFEPASSDERPRREKASGQCRDPGHFKHVDLHACSAKAEQPARAHQLVRVGRPPIMRAVPPVREGRKSWLSGLARAI